MGASFRRARQGGQRRRSAPDVRTHQPLTDTTEPAYDVTARHCLILERPELCDEAAWQLCEFLQSLAEHIDAHYSAQISRAHRAHAATISITSKLGPLSETPSNIAARLTVVPVKALNDAQKAYDMAENGRRTKMGATALSADKFTGLDATYQALGLKPSRIADIRGTPGHGVRIQELGGRA